MFEEINSNELRDTITTSKKPWTPEEDERLNNLVNVNGTGDWSLISDLLQNERTGKQCRERWHNHLNPDVNKGEWTPEEDNILISMQKVFGNQWCKVKTYNFDFI